MPSFLLKILPPVLAAVENEDEEDEDEDEEEDDDEFDEVLVLENELFFFLLSDFFLKPEKKDHIFFKLPKPPTSLHIIKIPMPNTTSKKTNIIPIIVSIASIIFLSNN